MSVRLTALERAESPAPCDIGPYKAAIRRDHCAFCGGPAGEYEHIEPRAKGGANNWSNITAACMRCNRRKGTRTLLAFLLGTDGPR